MDSPHTVSSGAILPNGSLTLLGVNHLHLLALESLSEVPDIVKLTSPRSDITGNSFTVTVEIGTIESTSHDAAILTVDMGTNEIVLLIAIETILIIHRNLVGEIKINDRVLRKHGSSTNVRILRIFLRSCTNSLSSLLSREGRTNKIFATICHNLKNGYYLLINLFCFVNLSKISFWSHITCTFHCFFKVCASEIITITCILFIPDKYNICRHIKNQLGYWRTFKDFWRRKKRIRGERWE